MIETTNILITNAHSANRGDEAAIRGMIGSLKKFIPNAKFTVLSNSPNSCDLQGDVEILPFFFVSGRKAILKCLLWILIRRFGINIERFGSRESLKILQRANSA
ncbi:unnamed protein product, partial [marine sediment metagenome]